MDAVVSLQIKQTPKKSASTARGDGGRVIGGEELSGQVQAARARDRRDKRLKIGGCESRWADGWSDTMRARL